MKKHLYISFFLCFFSYELLYSQALVTNDGLAITVQAGLTTTIQGSVTNQTKGADLGTIANAGTITLTGNWTNNSANTVFSSAAGTVQFIGTTSGQTIGGTNATSFYNLTINNTFATIPQITLGIGSTVQNTFTMTAGKINLGNFTFTLGTAAGTPGALSYTSGFMYGGNFTRWMGTSTYAVTNALGHFPMGSSAGHYRPFWLGITTSNLTTGGTVTLSHTAVYPALYTATSYSDLSWSTPIEGVSQSTWNVSTANSLTAAAGTRFDIRFGGEGFGTNVLTDLNATLLATSVGTYAAATSVLVPFEANRTGLTQSELTNSGGTQAFRLGSRNLTQSPLPIHLLSFEGRCENGQDVKLNWQTASEQNNDFFTLERSIDNENWEIMGNKDGAGNSNEVLSYYMIDQTPLETAYYRLKQTDIDGRFNYSNLIFVACEQTEDLKPLIFPNPSNGLISIKNTLAGQKMVLTNQLGQVLFQEILSSDHKDLDLTYLPKGIYFVEISGPSTPSTSSIILR